MESVVTDVANFRVVGSRPPDLRELLQGSGTSNTTVQLRVMGDVSSDWEEPERFPPQGDPPAGRDSAKEGRDGQVDLSAATSVNEGIGFGGGGCVRPLPPEYRHPVHHHLVDTGDMYCGGPTARAPGVDDMVVSGRNLPRVGRDGNGCGDRVGEGRGGQKCGGGGGGEEEIERVGENWDGDWDIKYT